MEQQELNLGSSELTAEMFIKGALRPFVDEVMHYLIGMFDEDINSPLHAIGHIEHACREYSKLIKKAYTEYHKYELIVDGSTWKTRVPATKYGSAKIESCGPDGRFVKMVDIQGLWGRDHFLREWEWVSGPQPQHTCANDDGKRDVGMAVDPCEACEPKDA